VLSTAEIENYPGFPKGIAGWELADLFSAHMDGYPVDRLRGDVTSLIPTNGKKALYAIHFAEGRKSIQAKTIILASGVQHRLLGAPGEERLTGKGVSYCAVCDGNFYRSRDVAVVGGGNSALEEALYLARIANKVYVIHRREDFRGSRHYQDKAASMPDKIELVTSHIIDEIQGEANLESVILPHVQTGVQRILPVEGLFIYVGLEPHGGFLPAALNRNPQGFIITDTEMATNLPGIFAAGDIRSKHCRQVSSAVGDGATAATAAFSYVEQLDA
jgi:thioredoxin reductase (NADPH)